MSDDAIFTEEDFSEGETSKVLGPAYFSARRYVDGFMQGTDEEPFRAIVKKAADEFYDDLRSALEDFLVADTEANLQGRLWRTVDATVEALLIGEKWALERYAIGDRYDAKAVREAIIRHAPPELWDKRVTDLQAEADLLREELKRERELNRDRYS